MKALYSNNRLIKSGQYSRIMRLYNLELTTKGKCNASKFYREVIQPSVPNYKLNSWLAFLKRIENDVDLVVARANAALASTSPESATMALQETMIDAATATRLGIARALNIGADALNQILDHPELMSPKDRADLLMKAMKAQDSRIHATAKIRQDSRQQTAFDVVFTEAAYGGRDE